MSGIDVSDLVHVQKSHREFMRSADFYEHLIESRCSKTGAAPRIEIGYEDQGGQHLFFVRDNGIGIAPEDQTRIFEIFKRLHTDREYEGSGAGLYIVSKIVGDHGGRVWVESAAGRGSTFKFTLPKIRCGEKTSTKSSPLNGIASS